MCKGSGAFGKIIGTTSCSANCQSTNEVGIIPDGGVRVGDLSSQLTIKLKKGGAIDTDHRIMQQ